MGHRRIVVHEQEIIGAADHTCILSEEIPYSTICPLW
jgi:hypothetical protein